MMNLSDKGRTIADTMLNRSIKGCKSAFRIGRAFTTTWLSFYLGASGLGRLLTPSNHELTDLSPPSAACNKLLDESSLLHIGDLIQEKQLSSSYISLPPRLQREFDNELNKSMIRLSLIAEAISPTLANWIFDQGRKGLFTFKYDASSSDNAAQFDPASKKIFCNLSIIQINNRELLMLLAHERAHTYVNPFSRFAYSASPQVVWGQTRLRYALASKAVYSFLADMTPAQSLDAMNKLYSLNQNMPEGLPTPKKQTGPYIEFEIPPVIKKRIDEIQTEDAKRFDVSMHNYFLQKASEAHYAVEGRDSSAKNDGYHANPEERLALEEERKVGRALTGRNVTLSQVIDNSHITVTHQWESQIPASALLAGASLIGYGAEIARRRKEKSTK